MKWLKRGAVLLCLMCAMLFVRADVAQAKVLDRDTTYRVDLNGDGKKENIRYTFITIGSGETGAICIYVNDKKQLTFMSSESGVMGDVSIVDINKSDSRKEIYIQINAEDAVFDGGAAYHYINGKLKRYFAIDDPKVSYELFISDKQPGNGKVNFDATWSDTDLHMGHVILQFKISSGKLVPVRKKILNTTSEWRKNAIYKATIPLRVYNRIGDTSSKFTIKEGTVFRVYKIRLKNANDLWAGVSEFYVKTSDGKSGWVKNPQKSFFVGKYLEYGYEEWGEYAFTWG